MNWIGEALDFDKEYWLKGFYPLAGIDEAGRGALFGPVVAAAVILDREKKIPNFCDSKAICEKKREELFEELKKNGHIFSVGIIGAREIDRINILNATLKAMELAFRGLKISPEVVLVDGNTKPKIDCRAECVVKGDKKSLTIGAASIVAKVTRDRILKKLDEDYPGYGFKNNKGYGTKEHIEAIQRMGVTPLHRKSFRPVSEFGNSLWQ